MIRDVGDRLAVRYESRAIDGTLTNATVVLTVTAPSGSTSTPSITNTSTGIYDAAFDLNAAGHWTWKWAVSGAVTDVAYGSVDVQDPSPPTYATLAELKATLRITDSTDDPELQDRLAAAARRIDRDTGRRFWQDATASARIYTPRHWELLQVDDIATLTGLVVEVGRGSTWTTVDSSTYETLPYNAMVKNCAIETLVRVVAYWPMDGITRVRVTAKWGWPTVPDEIKNANILLAARLFRRKDSPEGIKGFSDLGVVRVSRYDSDYDNLIGAYVRDVV